MVNIQDVSLQHIYFSIRQCSVGLNIKGKQFQLLVRGLWVSFQSVPLLASPDLHIQFGLTASCSGTQKSESQFLADVLMHANVNF